MKKRYLLLYSRVLAYTALFAAIITITIILIKVGQGYNFDLKKRTIVPGGLVLLDSIPNAATIYLNDKDLQKTTDERLLLSEGQYNLRLEKPGYRIWQKNIEVISTHVTWVKYPLLLPISLKKSAVAQYQSPVHMTASPNKKLAVIVNTVPAVTISLFEPLKDVSTGIYALPLTWQNEGSTISSITWAEDNEHILLTITAPSRTRYVIVNVQNPINETIDLSDIITTPASNIEFNPKDWRELYLIITGNLTRLDLATNQLVPLINNGVTSYSLAEDLIYVFVQGQSGSNLVRVERNNTQTTVLENLNLKKPIVRAISYDRSDYLLILDEDSQKVQFYSLAFEPIQEDSTRQLAGTRVLIGPTQQFAAFINGGNYTVYDFDLDKVYKFVINDKQVSHVDWFDDFHLLMTTDKGVFIYEFDGGNPQKVTDNNPVLPAISSSDKKLIYLFERKTDTGFNLLKAIAVE